MKISKSLLKTMAIGLTISATTSCGLVNDTMEDVGHNETCLEDCALEHLQAKGEAEEKCFYDCPACGMG